MLKWYSEVWKKCTSRCPSLIQDEFRRVCFEQAHCGISPVLIAFMYAVIQGDVTLEVDQKVDFKASRSLENAVDDLDDLDVYRVRIKQSKITLNRTHFEKKFFYSK